MSSIRAGLCCALVCALIASGGAVAGENPAGAEATSPEFELLILGELQSDLSAYEHVLALSEHGRTDPSLSPAGFRREVARASRFAPVLEQILSEKEAYSFGTAAFTLPAREPRTRSYRNLVVLLDMLQAFHAEDFAKVVELGKEAELNGPKELSVQHPGNPRLPVSLYREYCFLLATAHYRLGHDDESLQWLARIEAKSLKQVEQELAQEPALDPKLGRLAVLQGEPVALMPLSSLEKDPATEWVGPGLAEVLANDLLQNTELSLVERTELAKVLKELSLSQAGITGERAAASVGQLLSAGALIVGSYRAHGEDGVLSMHLVDGASGETLLAAEGKLRQSQLFADARAVLIELLGKAGWLAEDSKQDIASARTPRPDTIRDLLQARLLLASKSDQAKALYAQAMREDPSYAQAFADLKSQFASVGSTLAVMPLANASGVKDDLWMPAGVGEALATDLPRVGFTVVERGRLDALLREKELGQVMDASRSREVGQQLGADFVVLGSVLHQDPEVRLDVRFVDVRTGIVASAASAQGKADEFPKVLVALTKEIARRFNDKLSEQTLAQLAGKKMSREEFERFAREELTKESLAQKARVGAEVETTPSRAPFWTALGVAAAGTGLAVTGLALGQHYRDAASYGSGLLTVATRPDDQTRLASYANDQQHRANLWSAVGYAGAAVAAGGLGYLVYHELRGSRPLAGPVAIVPYATAGAGIASAGLTGSF